MERKISTSLAGAVAVLLAALGLLEVVSGTRWFLWCAGTIGAVVLLGQVLSRTTRNLTITSLAQMLLVGYLALRAASGVSFAFGVLPTGQSFTMLPQLVRATLHYVREGQPPVDPVPGLVALLVLLVGLSAVCMDILLPDLRSPVAASLVLVLLHLVPMAVLVQPAPLWSFVAAASGFAVVLWANERDRVQHWGRTKTGARALLSLPVAAVLTVASLVVAGFVPSLVPDVDQDDRFHRVGSGGVITIANPVFDLRNSLTEQRDTPILSYTTSAQNPAPIRLAVVDTYDGVSFAPPTEKLSRDNKVQNGIPAPFGLTTQFDQAEKVTTQFKIASLSGSAFLPVTDIPRKVNISGRWLYDSTSLNILGSGRTVEPDLSYTVDSVSLNYTREQLQTATLPMDSSFYNWTAVPSEVPAVIGTEARKVAGNGTPYDQAVALQRYFRSEGGFKYSLEVPEASDGAALEEFLVRKTGFCVHYASAMALMARTLSIPSRVVTGFLPGTKTDDGSNQYTVTGEDAHAWPELFFADIGWVRFEPTPSNRIGTLPEWSVAPDEAPEESPVDESAETPQTEPETPTDTQPNQELDTSLLPDESPADVTATEATSSWVGKAIVWTLIALLILLGLLLLPVAFFILRRQAQWRSNQSPPEQAWQGMVADLADLGVTFPPAATEHDVAASLKTTLDKNAHGAVDQLLTSVSHSRYAPADYAADPAHLRHSHHTVLRQAAKQATPKRRWLARLLPGLARRW